MHQQGARYAAWLRIIGQRNVVTDNHHVDAESRFSGFLCRQPKIEPIAGVVFHNQQTSRLTGNVNDGVINRVHAGRGKYIPADGRRQHPFADKADVRRFVAGTATRDQRDLLFGPVPAHHDANARIDLQPHQIAPRAGVNHAIQRAVDEIILFIHYESGHVFIPHGHA